MITDIDPKNITDFNRDTDQLQAFWLFCMFVAGKNSDWASKETIQARIYAYVGSAKWGA